MEDNFAQNVNTDSIPNESQVKPEISDTTTEQIGTNPIIMQNGQNTVYIPNVPNMYRPKRETKYTQMKQAFIPYGIGSILYGILFTICLYKGFHGISMPVLMIATIVGLFLAMKQLGATSKKADFFYILCMELLAVSCCLTGDMALVFFNVCGMFLLGISWMLYRFCNTGSWGFPKYLLEILNSIFVPIGYVDGFFKALGHYFSKKEETTNSKAKYIWLGVLLGVPFVVIVTALLVSADAVFGNMFDEIFKNITFPENPIWMVILLAVGILGSFALIGYFADDKIRNDVKEQRTWEPIIAITFLSFSTIVYLIFSVVQIMYLFIGGFALPEGYTYATYAHEGFYQLLAVCLINLFVLFICIGKFRENLVLKMILTVFSVCTYIMLCSSALRMVLYVEAYQLTYLRIMTLWGLLVIGIVLIGCVITIWKNTFPLFQYATVIVTVLYIGLSFARPGYVIATYNLADSNAKIDTTYLMDLNTDALSVYIQSGKFDEQLLDKMGEYLEYESYGDEIYDNCKQNEEGDFIYKPSFFVKLSDYQDQADEMGITNFNFSYYKAGKMIEQKVGKLD